MDRCENGCPCDQFDCDLALNVTDPVTGLEYLGVLDDSGKCDQESLAIVYRETNTLYSIIYTSIY